MEPTQTGATPIPASNQPSATTPLAPPNKSQKQKGLIFGIVICAILAIAGIAFGVYEFLDSNQKSAQISDLKTDVADKTTKITELETTISNLDAEKESVNIAESGIITDDSESETTIQDGTAAVILGDIIDENETRTVFSIGQCTADGPSVKCPITTPNGEALISYVSNDSILRLTLPKN